MAARHGLRPVTSSCDSLPHRGACGVPVVVACAPLCLPWSARARRRQHAPPQARCTGRPGTSVLPPPGLTAPRLGGSISRPWGRTAPPPLQATPSIDHLNHTSVVKAVGMDGGAADGAAGVTGGRRRARCRPVVDGRLGRGCRRTAKTRGRRTGRALHLLVAGPQHLERSNRKTKARGTTWAHNLLKKHQRGKEGASTVAASPLSLTSAAIGESKVLGVFRPPSLPRPRVGYMLPPGRGPAPQSTSPSRGQPPPDESTSTYTGPPRPSLPPGRSPRVTPARSLPSQFTPTAATPLATALGVGGGGGSGRVPTAALAPRPPLAP